MRIITAAAAAVLIFLSGCATSPPEQAKVPDFPSGYGITTEMPDDLAAAEKAEKAADEPEEVTETAEVLREEPVEEEKEVSEQPDAPEAAAVLAPPPPEKPVVSQESIEAKEAEEKIAETPEPAEIQAPDKPKVEETEKVEEPADRQVLDEPEKEETIAERQDEEIEKAPAPEEPELAVVPPADRAAEKTEDDDSTLFRAAWIGLPILLLILVVLVVEMIRWIVYKRPLFGWSGENQNFQAAADISHEAGEDGSAKKEKTSLSARINTFLDNLYKDLEEDEYDDDGEKES